eukprot:gene14201-20171_t
MEGIPSGMLHVGPLVEAGLLPARAHLIEEGGLEGEVTGLVLEALARVAAADSAPHSEALCISVVPALLNLLRLSAGGLAFILPTIEEAGGVAGKLDLDLSAEGGGCQAAPTEQEWQLQKFNVFMALSCIVRLAKLPDPAKLLLQGGSTGVHGGSTNAHGGSTDTDGGSTSAHESSTGAYGGNTFGSTGSPPCMIPQTAVLALHRLVAMGSADQDTLQLLLHCEGIETLCAVLANPCTEVSVRNMSSSMLLDMALLPEAAALCAEHRTIGIVVGIIMGAPLGTPDRMHALLLLARLCNSSARCRMCNSSARQAVQ